MSWTSDRARHAVLTRHYGPDHPDTQTARRDLAVSRLEDHIKQVVDDAPPLTTRQLDDLANLLRGAAT